MNLSDTFYVALCMTILILGAVYWFWTQNQFILRKLNLLENIVYEMKAALPPAWGSGDVHPGAFGQHSPVSFDTNLGASLNESPSVPVGGSPATYAPAPGSVMSEEDIDILHEDLSRDVNPPVIQSSPTLEISSSFPHESSSVSDDLQPGGVGSNMDEQGTKNANSYDNMTRKELVRLAETRGIAVAPNMRKQAIIDALKVLPFNGTINTQLQTGEGSLTMSDEGILDLS